MVDADLVKPCGCNNNNNNNNKGAGLTAQVPIIKPAQ